MVAGINALAGLSSPVVNRVVSYCICIRLFVKKRLKTDYFGFFCVKSNNKTTQNNTQNGMKKQIAKLKLISF